VGCRNNAHSTREDAFFAAPVFAKTLRDNGKSRGYSLLKNCFGVEIQKLIAGICFDLLSRQLSAKNRGSHLVPADG
jgi:hypothetical protein